MGRCKPRANENDPGLITLPEGIDELSDAVEQELCKDSGCWPCDRSCTGAVRIIRDV